MKTRAQPCARFKSWGGQNGTKLESREGEARDRAGEGVCGGGSVNPTPDFFWNFELQIVQSGVGIVQR